VVRLQWNPQVRSGARISVRLTVRFPAAPTPDGTVTRVMLLAPGRLVEGEEIPVPYDPEARELRAGHRCAVSPAGAPRTPLAGVP
jgi:hypothetical protein